MTAFLNQDFVTYQGDDVSPVFTVYADATAQTVADISTVSNIIWRVQRNAESGAVSVLTKTKAAGQVAFLNTGTDGKFVVTITKADTAALDGYYLHIAQLVDAVGNVSTATVGRMQVGLHPVWTFDPTQVSATPLYQVRSLIGDIINSDQQLPDSTIDWAISNYSNIWLAGAECCRMLAAQFSRKVDTVQGEIRTLYSQQSKNYKMMALDLEQRGLLRGASMPYAGGISISDKTTQVEDTDRVPPQFNLAWGDNLLPVGPAGQQTPTPGSPEFSTSDSFPV